MHTRFSTRCRNCLGLTAFALFAIVPAHAVAADPNTAAFATENEAAMTKMMAGMHIKSSGDVDHDFALMMIAHHQGAIDMAQAQLRYGKSEQLRRIAQEIIVDQVQEIAAMRMALDQPLPPAAPVPTQIPPVSSSSSSTPHSTHVIGPIKHP